MSGGAGLRPRPEVPPEALAAVVAAAQQLWPRPAPPPQPADTSHLAWRFSGRWWSRPVPVRRARPYTGR